MKVLIVDDEASMRALLAEALQDHGLETLEARNGAEGLLLVQRERPEVVVLDLIMPRVNGIETLQQMRKLAAPPRVVVLTASTYAALHQTARTLGASEVYTKPVDLDLLARRIVRLARRGGPEGG